MSECFLYDIIKRIGGVCLNVLYMMQLIWKVHRSESRHVILEWEMVYVGIIIM